MSGGARPGVVITDMRSKACSRHALGLAISLLLTTTGIAQSFDLQAALDAARDAGGGRVVLPKGEYRTGTIRVYADIELHLPAGSRLVGSTDSADYDPAHPHLLWGEDADNFSLTGPGTIDGSGTAFFDTLVAEGRNWDPRRWRPEPFIRLSGQNLRLTDFSLVNSPAHCLDITDARFVFIRGLRIDNDYRSPNTDGIDLRRTSDVMISDCYIRTGDDAICLKANDGPVERVTITNCVLSSDDAAVKLGTGSSDVIRDVRVSNCVIDSSRYALTMFMTQGGRYENISLQHVSIRTGSRHYSGYPIFVDNEPRSTEYGYGTIRDLRFENLRIYTDGNVLIGGHPTKPLENVTLRDVDIHLVRPVDLGKRVRKPRGNKTFTSEPGAVDYARQQGSLVLAHVRGLRMDGVRVHGTAPGREEVIALDTEP